MRVLLVAAALLALGVSARADEVTLEVPAGKTASEEFYVVLPGCQPFAQLLSKVLKPPVHGKLDISRGSFIASAPPCKGTRVTGTKYYYTPAKGFRGQDYLEIEIGYPVDSSSTRNTYTTYEVTLDVR